MALIIDTKSALLQALLPGEGYGRELIERVKAATKGAVFLLEGRVYPALREMEADGLVKSWESEPIPERGGRPRRYYELTALGRRTATEERKAVIGLFMPLARATS
jgi:PadR family transcriptional regulator PadR